MCTLLRSYRSSQSQLLTAPCKLSVDWRCMRVLVGYRCAHLNRLCLVSHTPSGLWVRGVTPPQACLDAPITTVADVFQQDGQCSQQQWAVQALPLNTRPKPAHLDCHDSSNSNDADTISNYNKQQTGLIYRAAATLMQVPQSASLELAVAVANSVQCSSSL